MNKEQAKELILNEFIKDNTNRFECGVEWHGFDEILSQSIEQYGLHCFRSVIWALDLGKIKVCEYIFDSGEFTCKDEITITVNDLKNCYNAVHRAA